MDEIESICQLWWLSADLWRRNIGSGFKPSLCCFIEKFQESHRSMEDGGFYIYIHILHTVIEHIFYHHEGTSLSSTTRRQTYTNPHILQVYSGRQACNCQWTQMGENQNAQNHHPESMLNLNSTSLILTKTKQRLIPCVQVFLKISTNINGNKNKVMFANKLCKQSSPTTQCVALDPSSSVPAPWRTLQTITHPSWHPGPNSRRHLVVNHCGYSLCSLRRGRCHHHRCYHQWWWIYWQFWWLHSCLSTICTGDRCAGFFTRHRCHCSYPVFTAQQFCW